MQSRSTTPLRNGHKICYNSTMLPIYDDQPHSTSTRRRFRKRRQALTRFLLTCFSILALFASFWSLHRMRQVNEESIQKLNMQRQEELNTTFSTTVTESIPVAVNIEKDNKDDQIIKHEMETGNKAIIMKPNYSSKGNKVEKTEKLNLEENVETKSQNSDKKKQEEREKNEDLQHEEKDEEIEQQHQEQQQTDMLDEEEGGNSLNVELPTRKNGKKWNKNGENDDDPERDNNNGNEEEIDQSARKDLNDEEKHISNENDEQIDQSTRQELGE